MIEKVYAELLKRRQQIAQDSLEHTPLGIDSHAKYLQTSGRYKGLGEAIQIVEDLMNGRLDVEAN